MIGIMCEDAKFWLMEMHCRSRYYFKPKGISSPSAHKIKVLHLMIPPRGHEYGFTGFLNDLEHFLPPEIFVQLAEIENHVTSACSSPDYIRMFRWNEPPTLATDDVAGP